MFGMKDMASSESDGNNLTTSLLNIQDPVDEELAPPHSPVKQRSWRPKLELKGLNTFMGVVVPCMISIIGVILYLRLGRSVGQAGVLGVLAMFSVGYAMALMTDLSLSAIASNGRVGGGGTYYLISRSVGPQLGGAIGLMFYAANAVGIGFYLSGFTETMANILGLPDGEPSTYWIKVGLGAAVLIFEAVICIISANLYAKCAFFVFIIQMVSIYYGNIALFAREPFTFTSNDCKGLPGGLCSYVGPNIQTLRDNLFPQFDDGFTVSNVFGVLFPAITGIMAGTNMSGVLKRPQLSIPRGELTALLATFLTYVLLLVTFGASVPRATLKADTLILSNVTWWPWGVTIGVLTSTMSSTFASMQSAARLLQAIALDGIIPPLRFFKNTWRGEPAYGIVISCAFGFGLLMIGSLDVISPILAMFFLMTYATTNFAAFLHSLSGHPNFRPRFRYFSWVTALIGFVTAVAIMIYIQWIFALVAVIVAVLIAWYIAEYAPPMDWGEVSQSLIFHQVRKYLLKLDTRKEHVKFWRAKIMYFARSPFGSVNQFEFVNHLKKGGLFIVGDVVVQPTDEKTGEVEVSEELIKRVDNQRKKWVDFISEAQIKAFVNVTSSPTLRLGLYDLMVSTGLGGMRPNTLLLEFYDKFVSGAQDHSQCNSVFSEKNKGTMTSIESAVEWFGVEKRERSWDVSSKMYVQMLQDMVRCNYNLLLLRNFAELDFAEIATHKKPSWASSMAPAPRDNRYDDERYCSIDVWDVPWGSKVSLDLTLQLVSMLSDSDFWQNHTYLRICSLIEDDDTKLTRTREKYGELYQEMIRDQRVRSHIQMFVLSQDEPEIFHTAVDEASRVSSSGYDKTSTSYFSSHRWTRNVPETPSVLETLPQNRAAEIVAKFIQKQRGRGSVVTFFPLPPVPSSDITNDCAEEYLEHVRRITNNMGPVVLVSGVEPVITTDL